MAASCRNFIKKRSGSVGFPKAIGRGCFNNSPTAKTFSRTVLDTHSERVGDFFDQQTRQLSDDYMCLFACSTQLFYCDLKTLITFV